MKKLLLLLASIMSICIARAQEEDGPTFETLSVPSPESMELAQQTKGKDFFLPLQGKRHVHIYPTLDMCTSLSQDKNKPDPENGNIEDKSSTGLSLNFGASIIFVPGKPTNEALKVNPLGFAYNFGFISAVEKSEKYEVTCSFLLKAGVEIGNQHAMGVGLDFLAGYGKSKGDVFFYNDIVEDTEPKSVTCYTNWCFQYGGQIWFRTGLLKDKIQGIEVLTFVQLLWAQNPNIMTPVSKNHMNLWKGENWKIGIMVRYPF